MANKDWQAYQLTQGAILSDEAIRSFGDPQKELLDTQTHNTIYDLSHLGLLEISGEDALTFLQGQVTNDVKLLNSNNSHYTGYCNPKGRLLALFFALTHKQKLHLQLNNTLIEPIAKRLKMYVMRAKVDIHNVSDNAIKIGLHGFDAATLLSQFFNEIPQQAYDLNHNNNNHTLIRLPGISPRFEIICDLKSAKEIWQALKVNCKPAGKSCWDWLEIQAGIPDVYPQTQEEFVPQMLNLDLNNAISFKKGCYTGQEIVARTHYLGKIKRRTHIAHVATFTAPQAGENVLNQNKEIVGKVVRIAAAPMGGYDLLVEVRLESLATDDVSINDKKLKIKHLPDTDELY